MLKPENGKVKLIDTNGDSYYDLINVTDYEVEASTQVTEIAASDKKKRTSEKKVMRRNE